MIGRRARRGNRGSTSRDRRCCASRADCRRCRSPDARARAPRTARDSSIEHRQPDRQAVGAMQEQQRRPGAAPHHPDRDVADLVLRHSSAGIIRSLSLATASAVGDAAHTVYHERESMETRQGRSSCGTESRPNDRRVAGNAKLGYVSDVAAEMLRRLGIRYIVQNPGIELRRPARQPGQLSRQPGPDHAALPQRAGGGRDRATATPRSPTSRSA